MFDVEKIAREALDIIKSKYGLPSHGFITGGSIANLMWEIVSGNKAIINDIDVFLFSDDGYCRDTRVDPKDHIFKYDKMEVQYFEAYQQMSSSVYTKDSYIIKESTNDGIFNYVKYESNNPSHKLIIESFDINCTRIGYSIDEDKFYWEKDFEEFLQSGELKISNLNTPAHTAIRILKKKEELNAKLDDFEIELVQYVLDSHKMIDINRLRFKQRYADMYDKYKSYLDRFFEIQHDEELEKYLVGIGVNDSIYRLVSKHEINFDKEIGDRSMPLKICIDRDATKINTSSDFLFYIRNIYNNEELKKLWEKIYYLYWGPEYIDIKINYEDIDFLSKLTKSYPRILNNLKGLKLSQQLEVTKRVLTNVSIYHDYETAIAVLENIKVGDIPLDEDECLILGLSVRKKVHALRNSGTFFDPASKSWLPF